MIDCPKCEGKGYLQITCRRCRGTGWVLGRYGGEICCGGVDDVECPQCKGEGQVDEDEYYTEE